MSQGAADPPLLEIADLVVRRHGEALLDGVSLDVRRSSRRPVCLGIAAATRQTVVRLLADVGLGNLARRPLAVLSGGELRRVLLAHALDPIPELLILDEPTSGLDERAVERLEEILVAIRRQHDATVLMVSHDLEQARRLADRVTVLDRRVVAEGTAAEILAQDSLRALVPTTAAGGARR
jgi:zinc transport system ATP-binding protein